jgi:hypothetical protein
VPRGIKNPNLTGYSAMSSDFDLLADREATCVADSGVIADNQCWLLRKAGCEEKTTFSIY